MTRLTELDPRWIHPNLFILRCPHCREVWLACKNAPMGFQEQCELYAKEIPNNGLVVPARDDFAWNIQGRDFASLSVTPSLDASASGHWHGFVSNGEVT